MNKYLISASSEYEGNNNKLNHWLQIKEPYFIGRENNVEFELEMLAEEDQEENVIKTALNLREIYMLEEIQVWKKNSDSEDLYSIGISFTFKNTELLLGRWADWTIFKNIEKYTEKDNQISDLESQIFKNA